MGTGVLNFIMCATQRQKRNIISQVINDHGVTIMMKQGLLILLLNFIKNYLYP